MVLCSRNSAVRVPTLKVGLSQGSQGKEPGGKKPIVTPSGRIGQFWATNSAPQHSGTMHTSSGYPEHWRCPWSHSLVPGDQEKMTQGPDSPEYGLVSLFFKQFFFQWGEKISLIYIYSKENALDCKGFPENELLFPSAVQHHQPGFRIFSEALTQVTPSAQLSLSCGDSGAPKCSLSVGPPLASAV